MQYFTNILNTIQKSVLSMNEETFLKLVDDCVDVLNNGHKIVASGLGKNVPVCDKFVGTMLSLGQRAGFMHTNTAVHGDLGMVQDGDLVIILTKSGETVESVYLTSLLKQRNVHLWLLTFSPDSTLVREISDSLILDLEHEGDMWNIVPNNSTAVNLIVLQGLALNIAQQRGVTLTEFKKNHPGGYIGVQLRDAE